MRRIFTLLAAVSILAAASVSAFGKKTAGTDREIIDRVAKWQIANHDKYAKSLNDWTNGALYRGMFTWAAYTSNQEYFDFLRGIGDKCGWGFRNRIYHADDICVAQMYADMYSRYGEEKMILPTRHRLDMIVHNPSEVVFAKGHKWSTDRWSWCDALFMAPPVFVQMYELFGDEKYLQFLDREYKLTTDILFDKEHHLFFRDLDYLERKEANGEPVFWGRGNGWVLAGLTFMLERLPQDHCTYGFYLDLYKEMCAAVIKCQDDEGSWHASMLDHVAYPVAENSSSGFFTYSIAWGVNHGILQGPEYRESAIKGWKALKTYVHEDGFLGNVQPIGAAPAKTGPDKTANYGVGAFLLAGTEMMKMPAKPKKHIKPDYAAAYRNEMPADRQIWVDAMTRIVEPLFVNLSEGTLRKNMPVETWDGLNNGNSRKDVTHLEALGRAFCGIAPWLNLGADETPEGKVRARYIDLVAKSIANAVDPSSPDCLTFDGPGGQPLVDAAFFAHGLIRSKDVIWPALDRQTQERVIASLKSSRKITAPQCNWLMFSAMVEAALLEFTGEYDEEPVKEAFTKHAQWYKGDGWYGDGPAFHMDYYNSYVIQPMLLDVSEVLKRHGKPFGEFYEVELPRIIRLAEIQERLISPEGSYPVLGRSMGYRFGAFQALAEVSLLRKLPLYIEPAQVRCALTAVINREMAPGTFDENGWITLGFCGHQPTIADEYVSTGSAYLCTFVFLPLGLPAEDPFWSAPAAMWSSQRAWSGLPVRKDHSIR